MAKRKFLLRRRNEFKTHYTVLDIGTEFVKALVVKREDDKGIVLGVGKVRQAVMHMQAGAVADIQSVIDNCDRALTEAEQRVLAVLDSEQQATLHALLEQVTANGVVCSEQPNADEAVGGAPGRRG